MKERQSLFQKMIVCLLMLCVFWIACSKTKVQAAIVSTDHSKYTYSELMSDIRDLKAKYPNTLTYRRLGITADNRKIYELIVGNRKAKKHLVVIANLHAREYMTIQLVMKQVEYYLANYNKSVDGVKLSDTLNKVAIHFVPSCNPDGTAISQSGFNAIRNTSLRSALKRMGGSSSTWKANARGVDLNRNWAVAFQPKGTPGSQGYRGPKAESENETKALVNMINTIQNEGKIVGVISYHSTGSIIYGRVVSKSTTSSVVKVTTKMYQLAQKLTGYYLMPTESIDSARGCSREYFLYKKKLPCITLEIGVNSCPLRISEFPSIWKKHRLLVIKEAMMFR